MTNFSEICGASFRTELILFKYDDVPARLREQRGDGRPGGAIAYNEHVAFSAILHS
jgi:hypothetical protein